MSRRSVNSMSRRLAPSVMSAVCALACVLSVTTLGGCRGDRSANRPRQFFPDMDDQPKYKAQSSSPVFADGRSMRPLVAGVIGFGSSTDPNDPERRWIFIESDAVALGLNPDGSYVERMPLRDILGVDAGERLTAAEIERFVLVGQAKFNIYCFPCHGAAGDGKGIVGQRWWTPLPTYHDAKYQRGNEKGDDGFFFHTIRNGVPNAPGALPALKMPSYSDRVSIENAWAIVSYIRAMQKTQKGELRDVPESVADGLLASRGAAPKNNANNTTEEPAP